MCLGQWEENGVMYTYTMRNDTSTNECFVGLIVNDEEIYIKEAGDHCLRDIDPRREGMRLYKKGWTFFQYLITVSLHFISFMLHCLQGNAMVTPRVLHQFQ